MAQDYLKLLEQQLATQNITINQYTEALNILSNLEKKKASLEKVLAVVIVKVPDTNIQNLLEEVRIREARAARLSAEATAKTGWDFGISLGSNINITDGKVDPMVGVYARYSFGTNTATKAASQVGDYTSQLMREQENGHYQTIIRQIKELEKIIEIETNIADASAKQLKYLNSVRNTIKDINSELAQNTLRLLNLQIKVLQADYYGSQQRRIGYVKLLDRLKQ